MKKQRLSCILTCIGCLLILLMSACGDDIDDDNSNTDDYEDEHPITSYTHLEEAFAEALGKTLGEEITPAELATVTHLTLPRPHNSVPMQKRFGGGTSLVPLAQCVNLKELDLSGHFIYNFSPLAGLTRLERLNLSFTLISDLEPLAGLVNLQRLNLSTNEVGDLAALAGMVQLKELYLQHNQIHDITPLVNLIQLEKLYLHNNMIVDLKPLVDNPGLVNINPVHLEGGFDWHEDVVGLHGNPLSDVSRNVYIPALQARGVNVRH